MLCGAKARVYDTQTEQEYCAKPFREVNREHCDARDQVPVGLASGSTGRIPPLTGW